MTAQRSDLERLQLFLDVVNDALGRRAVRNGLRTSWDWEWDEAAGDVRFLCDRGDEEDLRSLMLDLRKFVSNKEDVFLNKIFNLLWLMTADQDRLRTEVQHLRQSWKSAQNDTECVVMPDRGLWSLSPLECWDLWVNGGLFHNDQDLQSRYAALSAPYRVRVDYLAGRLVLDLVGILLRLRSVVYEFLPPPGW